MFDSQTIQMQGTTSTVLYSPWFPRGADYGLFTLELTAIGGTCTLTVTLIHKNSSVTGDGDPVPGGITSLSLSAVDRTTVDFAEGAGPGSPKFGGFEELVRYKFTLSGGSADKTSWATFRMLPPVWYDNVTA